MPEYLCHPGWWIGSVCLAFTLGCVISMILLRPRYIEVH